MYYKLLNHLGRCHANTIACAPSFCLFPDRTYRVLLIFSTKDFLDDIKDHAWLAGDAAIDSGIDAKVANHLIDIAEEENLPLIQRSIGLGISECEQTMLFLTKQKVRNHTSLDSDIKPHRPEYVIEMRVDNHSSDTTVVALQRLVFDYVKARIMRDYCLDAYPTAAERWGAQMDADKIAISEQARFLDKKIERQPWPIW